MAKLLPAQGRLFKNIFICKECKSKIRAEPIRIISGKVRCRKCKSNRLRPIRKK
jgi:ribosomal protein L40E